MDKKSLMTLAVLGLTLSNTALASEAAKKVEAKEEKGQCHGVNSCKGTSLCHSDQNSCAGTNSCKGKGWVKMTEKDCKTKKGKFVKG